MKGSFRYGRGTDRRSFGPRGEAERARRLSRRYRNAAAPHRSHCRRIAPSPPHHYLAQPRRIVSHYTIDTRADQSPHRLGRINCPHQNLQSARVRLRTKRRVHQTEARIARIRAHLPCGLDQGVAIFFGQQSDPDLRIDRLDCGERFPIETRNHRGRQRVVLADQLAYLALDRAFLDLDIEAEFAAHRFQNLLEGGNSLVAESRIEFFSRVEALDFLQGEIFNRTGTIGGAIDGVVMDYYHGAVARRGATAP